VPAIDKSQDRVDDSEIDIDVGCVDQAASYPDQEEGAAEKIAEGHHLVNETTSADHSGNARSDWNMKMLVTSISPGNPGAMIGLTHKE
jgi:hypothetical protein